MHPKNLSIQDFTYTLPDEKIAQQALTQRDSSKLLIYKDNIIKEDVFYNIENHLNNNTLIFSNKTKVVYARMLFKKATGANIEIFCLEPYAPTNDIQIALQLKEKITWKCFIGNAKKWKNEPLILTVDNIELKAYLIEKNSQYNLVEFDWTPKDLAFSQVLEKIGHVPLPPYINREDTNDDKQRYQTVFAKIEGSVAAPTAGLHFTPQLLESLKKKKIIFDEVTLHVGAGTFKPVDANILENHEMHHEYIFISQDNIKNILNNLDKNILAVGTTTMRTIESMYWLGVKAFFKTLKLEDEVQQWEPYSYNIELPSKIESLEAFLQFLTENNIDSYRTSTQIIIAPGYNFKIVDILITNFHQPQSTLLLLVAAFIGKDWKAVYQYALDNNFRFLSYGDACLFFKH